MEEKENEEKKEKEKIPQEEGKELTLSYFL